MIKQRKVGVLIFIISLVVVSLACGVGGSSEPVQIPPTTEATTVPADPTKVPDQPTTAPEPTEAIAEEPTEEPSEDPSEESIATPPVDEAVQETPPPANTVYIKTVDGYRDDLGYLHVVGLVTNNTDRSVDNVEVEVNIQDSDGNSLNVEITTISLYTLAPGETSPFSYWVSENVPDAEKYTATVVGQSVAEIERASLKIEGVMLTVDDNGDIHLTGRLVNNTVSPIQIESLAAATFDKNDQILTADSHSVIVRHLDPGEDCPFRVTMTGPEEGAAIDDYEIFIDAVAANPVEIFDFDTSESHYYYIDAFNSFHLVGEVTNNNDEFFTISLVAGIYDEDGNVLDAATTDIPTFSIAPGETLPYDFQYWGPLDYKTGVIDTASNYYVQWDPYWTWTSSSEYVRLTTINDSNQVDTFQVTFTGDVLNDSGEEVDGATIIVSLFDIESGELVATGYAGIYDPIAPNASTAYQVWISTPADFDIASVEYSIVAEGDLP